LGTARGLSSAAGMRKARRSRRYVFGLWTAIAVISGLAAVAGYTLLGGAPAAVLAAVTALAAGAILAMVADTMIPEAFDNAHLLIGLVTVAGFLVAFGLSHSGAQWRSASTGCPAVRALQRPIAMPVAIRG
jgi:ZIP family zinc transporter